MKLPTHVEKEEQLVEEQIRFFKMINGLLAGAFFVGLAIVAYKFIGLFL